MYALCAVKMTLATECPPKKEDEVTGEYLLAQDMFICECNRHHMLSYETFFRKILSDVRDRCVPACPLNAIPNG